MRPRAALLVTLFFFLFSVSSAKSQVTSTASAQPPGVVRLSIAASKAYAQAKDVPVKSALLITDTVRFHGKSGMVKLAKGQTTLYLLVSNLEASCETVDKYDRKSFLRANSPSLLPKLPNVAGDEDFVGIFLVQEHFDPPQSAGSATRVRTGGQAVES